MAEHEIIGAYQTEAGFAFGVASRSSRRCRCGHILGQHDDRRAYQDGKATLPLRCVVLRCGCKMYREGAA